METTPSKTPSQVSTLENKEITGGAFSNNTQSGTIGLNLTKQDSTQISIPDINPIQTVGGSISNGNLKISVNGVESDPIDISNGMPSTSSASVHIYSFSHDVESASGNAYYCNIYPQTSLSFFNKNTAVAVDRFTTQGVDTKINTSNSYSFSNNVYTTLSVEGEITAPSNFTANLFFQIPNSSFYMRYLIDEDKISENSYRCESIEVYIEDSKFIYAKMDLMDSIYASTNLSSAKLVFDDSQVQCIINTNV